MENTHKKKRLSDLCADAFTALENNSLDSRQSAKVNSTFGPHVKANKPELSNYSQLFAQVKKQLESL
ncbi:MAG: hypothetical protein K1X29_10685 [Bdellovibrionales bacterium]|nr:hypothetical protein [Bdellovibrionales bacterium]